MEKEVLELANQDEEANEAKEVEESEAEIDLPEDIFTLEILLNTRDFVVLYASLYLTTVKRHQRIK